MKNEILIYVVVGIIFLLIIGSVIFSLGILNTNISKNFESKEIKQINPELEKYRSKDIPEDCKLPEYESDIEQWKQHLSHHKQTEYCLGYYKTSIGD